MNWLRRYWAALHLKTSTPIEGLVLGLVALALGYLIGIKI
jgi:hypothetical protein